MPHPPYFIVLESTPGYLPDADPFHTCYADRAAEYALSLVDSFYSEQVDAGVLTADEADDNIAHAAASLRDDFRTSPADGWSWDMVRPDMVAPDLGRRVDILTTDEEPSDDEDDAPADDDAPEAPAEPPSDYAAARAAADDRVRQVYTLFRLVALAAAGRVADGSWDAADIDALAQAAELPNTADVLSVDLEACADVVLTLGGPTIYVRYWFGLSADREEPNFLRAEWMSTDVPSGRLTSVRLTDDEADALANAYVGGIDVLAQTIAHAAY